MTAQRLDHTQGNAQDYDGRLRLSDRGEDWTPSSNAYYGGDRCVHGSEKNPEPQLTDNDGKPHLFPSEPR